MVPSAAIIPPRSGIAEPENMLPPPPPSAGERGRPARCLVPDREVGDRARAALLDVLEAAREDVLDIALEPERRAPHDRLVGRVEPGQAGLVDDLLHRAGLGHRRLERPPVGGEHRPDHRAGHGDRGHRLGEDDHDDPARDGGRAEQDQTQIGTLSPRMIPTTPATTASTPRPIQRAHDLARLLGEPARDRPRGSREPCRSRPPRRRTRASGRR